MQTCSHNTSCECLAALYIFDKNRKQPKRPSLGKRADKVWFIHTTEHHSAMKRNTPLTHNDMDESQRHQVNGRNQVQKVISYGSVYMTLWQRQRYRVRKQISRCYGLRIEAGPAKGAQGKRELGVTVGPFCTMTGSDCMTVLVEACRTVHKRKIFTPCKYTLI